MWIEDGLRGDNLGADLVGTFRMGARKEIRKKDGQSPQFFRGASFGVGRQQRFMKGLRLFDGFGGQNLGLHLLRVGGRVGRYVQIHRNGHRDWLPALKERLSWKGSNKNEQGHSTAKHGTKQVHCYGWSRRATLCQTTDI